MTTNVERFNKQLAAFGEKVHKVDFSKLQRLTALTVLRGVVLKTPVDSGRARGNWQLMTGSTVESEVSGTTTVTGKGKKRKRRWTSGGGGPVGTGMQNLAPGFKTIYIFNNVPYINALEQGRSKKQAPRGMVAVTLVEAQQVFVP